MFQMATRRKVQDRTGAIRRAVIQCVTDMGFSPHFEAGKRSIKVSYRQPSRMKSLKPVYMTVAEVEILSIEEGAYRILVRPRLYGHDRPKVDELIECLKAKIVEGGQLEVVIER